MPLPSDIANLLSNNPALALPVVFAGGVLTSWTPCIYPMIPITVAIVGGQSMGAGSVAQVGDGGATGGAARQSRWRTVSLTLSYAVGLALVYALLGAIAGLTGTLFGSISTNPWLYFAMANLLILFARAMLDVLPVRVPQAVLRRANEAGKSGGVAGAFAMGAASGLVAAPCGAPVMAAVLTWVSLTKSAFLGFIYLFVFSLGMTSLLVAVGLSTGLLARLPRAGVWMLWVKRGFALLMLAAAEYYLIEMGKLLL
jgi:thiol:disulfide interchange protein DsbD